MKSNSITLFATLLVVAGGGAGPSNTAAAATRPPEYQRATTALSPSYPLFSQCDAKWADDEMGVPGAGERATICKEGCAMSCVAMALAGHRIYINNSEPTPKTLNRWLEATHNYECAGGDCNNLVLAAPGAGHLPGSALEFISEAPKPAASQMAADLAAGTVVYIAHVRKNSHFVLLTQAADKTAKRFRANDPYFNEKSYAYTDMSDVITYKVLPHVEPVAYVAFDQCDSRWGSKVMGANNRTICEDGCLMSGITAGLAGWQVPVEGKPADPSLMDVFLQHAAGGFAPGSSALNEAAVAGVSPRVKWPSDGMRKNDNISYAELTAILTAPIPRVMVANVNHGGHFVLAVGVDAVSNDTVWVRDSYFNRATYSLKEDVVGWRIFDIAPPATLPERKGADLP